MVTCAFVLGTDKATIRGVIQAITNILGSQINKSAALSHGQSACTISVM
jgi:hypothetical protein